MSEFVTRCPKCATAFRISDSLLNSPKGIVRCGSCMNVFNAKQHLVQRKTTPTSRSIDQEFQFFDRQATQTKGQKESNFNISGEEQQLSPITRSPRDFPPYSNAGSPSDLFERSENSGDSIEASSSTTTLDEDDVDDDEAWALDLLKDDSEPDVQLKKISEPHQSSDGRTTASSAISPEPPSIESLADVELEIPKTAARHDETFFEEALPPLESAQNSSARVTEPKTENAPAKPTETGTSTVLDAPDRGPNQDATTTSEAVSQNAPEPSQAEQNPAAPKSTQQSTQQEPQGENAFSAQPTTEIDHAPAAKLSQNRQNAIDKYTAGKESIRDVVAQIEPEPLEVSWQGDKIHWLRRLMWPLLVIIALTVLLVQVAWLEFHRLNRIEPYRSVYGIACQVLGCQLPALVDRSAVRTSNLLVRSHPDVENALMVDVILQNNAEFEQSFPSLLLTFTDMRGKPLAVRKLLPGEYLGGELSGASAMPVRQPIHISLEIVDPGQNAVSYHIEIVD